MPSEASAAEDTRVWIGRVTSGHDAEQAAFLAWLNGPDAEAIFRRRRLTEYRLAERDGQLTVLFRAPHTGDPRLLIDFLRYPGLWPEFWQFERAGHDEADAANGGEVKVHWRRAQP